MDIIFSLYLESNCAWASLCGELFAVGNAFTYGRMIFSTRLMWAYFISRGTLTIVAIHI